MWPDPLLILAFEIVGSTFLLGWLVGSIVSSEIAAANARGQIVARGVELNRTKETRK